MKTHTQWLFETPVISTPTGYHGLVLEDAWELDGFGRELEWESDPTFDVNKAVQYNLKHMASVGWQPYIDDIVNLLGFTTYTPNERTFTQAVAIWQHQKGLPPDGKIRPDTWEKMKSYLGLKSGTSPNGRLEEYRGFASSLQRFGSELESVINRHSPMYIKWVQESLNQVMNAGLIVDGVLGSRTRRAIAHFQKRATLRPDGIVGLHTEKALIAAGAKSPPSNLPASSPGIQSTIPRLLSREITPKELTLYVEISLSKSIKPVTGIFIPGNYRPQNSVDLILYLHGYLSPSGFSKHATIQDYWKNSTFAFREGVNASGKNVILIAPTLGSKSETGNLLKPGGLERYLDQVIAALGNYGPHKQAGQIPTVGNVILACHSGGGLPMRELALSQSKYAAKIKECWGFDCTYNTGDDTQWAQWARSNPSCKLFIYYISKKGCRHLKARTEVQAIALQKLAAAQNLKNITVEPANTCRHNQVPLTYWESRIKAAPFLRNR